MGGIKYLVSKDQINKVLRLPYCVRDSVVITGSMLLVPLDPRTLTQNDLALIEREFTVLMGS